MSDILLSGASPLWPTLLMLTDLGFFNSLFGFLNYKNYLNYMPLIEIQTKQIYKISSLPSSQLSSHFYPLETTNVNSLVYSLPYFPSVQTQTQTDRHTLFAKQNYIILLLQLSFNLI